MRARRAAVVLLAATLAAPAAVAQQAPIVRPLRLERFAGWIELGYDFEDQTREPPLDGEIFRQDESSLLYGVGLDVKGSLLHSSLLPFSLGGTIRQRRSDVNANTGAFQGTRTSDADQIQARLGILPAFRWSGEIVANRFLQDIDSTFAPRRTLLRRDLRFGLTRRSRSWPLRLGWNRALTEGVEGDPRDETRERWTLRVEHVGDRSGTHLAAEALDYVERSTRQDYRQVLLSAGHRARPGEAGRWLLSSSFYGYDRTGTSDVRFWVAGQGVEWNDDPWRLRTALEVKEQDDVLGELSTRRGYAEGQHELWGSLTTTLAYEVQRTDLPVAGRESLREGRIEFDYARHLPRGTFSAVVSGRFRRDDQDLPAERSIVTERHVVEQDVPIPIDTPNPIEETIEVTDATGAQIFVEGFDYELIRIGDLVEIRVLPGSDIVPGTEIRVRFAVETSPALDVRTETSRLGFAWRDRSGIWVRVGRVRQSQDVLRGVADGRVDQSTEETYALGVERPRWRAEVSGIRKASLILPYERRRIGGGWTALSSRIAEARLRARAQRTTFPDRPGQEISLILAGADVRFRLGRLRIDLAADRWDETVLDRDGTFLESRLDVRWRWYNWEFIARVRDRRQDIEMSGRDDRMEVRLALRRYFR